MKKISKASRVIALIIVIAMVIGLVLGLAANAEGETLPQYRLLNPRTGEHFYSVNPEERNALILGRWTYEGITGLTPGSSDAPVYRLCNLISGEHHYTMDITEKDTLAGTGTWRDEGAGWYSGGDVPVYRLFDPSAAGMGAHHYTSDENEREQLVNNGWRFEGTGWYVYSAEGFSDPNPAPEVPKPAPITAESRVTAVGDSVMLGAANALRSTIPGSVVDAAESRQVINTLSILKALDAQGQLGSVVVLGVGTNGPFTESTGQEIIDYLGPERNIFWVNIHGDSIKWAVYTNNMIRHLANKNSNVTLIDFNSEGAMHPDWFYNDGIHLRPAGQTGYAEFVRRCVFG